MASGSKPAFARPAVFGEAWEDFHPQAEGLTKLEYAAIHIMAAYSAADDAGHIVNRAQRAVAAAKVLLETLEEEEGA